MSTTTKPVTLYAYGISGKDPHEVALLLAGSDRQAIWEAPEGDWVAVEHLETGEAWNVRRVDCGGGCRCACEAVPA